MADIPEIVKLARSSHWSNVRVLNWLLRPHKDFRGPPAAALPHGGPELLAAFERAVLAAGAWLMDILVRLPDASCPRPEAAKRYRIPGGTPVHRLHPERLSADQLNDSSKTNARFSPIVDWRDKVIPAIYGAETFECAVAEIRGALGNLNAGDCTSG
ncbi:hypothetical protein PNH50_14045 [Leisingera aquaemixtae]|uniref:hypothetical protein n=1 Tax=Leisingera aquaemixtae TaxID=1396826 RepID=UPI0039840095